MKLSSVAVVFMALIATFVQGNKLTDLEEKGNKVTQQWIIQTLRRNLLDLLKE